MTTTPPACTYPGCPDPHITRSGVMGCLLDGGDSDQPLVFASGTHLHVHDAEISRPSTRPRSERWSFAEGEATTTPPPEGTTEPREHSCDNCDGIDPPSCINYPPPARATNGPAPVVPDHEINALCLVDGCEVHGTQPMAPRPAPAVPDSAGLRERVAAAVDGVAVDHPAWGTAHTATRPFTDLGESNYRQFVEDITDAVLAVVGQGVTAEQAWDEGYEAGWRKRLNRNPYSAAVRPTGQEQADG